MNKELRFFWITLLLAAVVVQTGASARAQPEAGGEDAARMVRQVQDLIDAAANQQGAEKIGTYKKALEIMEQIHSRHPDDFKVNWKYAELCRLYGEAARKQKISRWEEICAEYGRMGMRFAERAIDLEPDRVEGYYFYGLATGTYSDGVGLFTALREGLKSKVQKNLEAAYRIDKSFDSGGVMIALGRFWQVVPWPYHDEKKAMKYYREFQNSGFFDDPDTVEVRIYMAEILLDERGEEPRAEARALLLQVPEMTSDPYWIERAETLLKQL